MCVAPFLGASSIKNPGTKKAAHQIMTSRFSRTCVSQIADFFNPKPTLKFKLGRRGRLHDEASCMPNPPPQGQAFPRHPFKIALGPAANKDPASGTLLRDRRPRGNPPCGRPPRPTMCWPDQMGDCPVPFFYP